MFDCCDLGCVVRLLLVVRVARCGFGFVFFGLICLGGDLSWLLRLFGWVVILCLIAVV